MQLDSHMGTLFASPAFLERYIKVGVSEQIPVMFPGGHNTLIRQQLQAEGGGLPEQMATAVGQQLWNAGLPVLDDLHNTSYGWRLAAGTTPTDENIRKMKVDKYIESFKSLKPGVTMMIMHCTDPTEVFQQFTDSGPTRKGDLLAMLDPAVRQALKDEGIILTTWRELKERRDQLAARKK